MLRQDFAIYQAECRDGHKIDIGLSLLLLMVVMLCASQHFMMDLAAFFLIVFSLHTREMIRAWFVRLLGLELHNIVLSGAGGHTVHESGTVEEEELIAAIGPITNFTLWALAVLALPFFTADGAVFFWLELFAFVNLFVGIATALPMMPMDGGRFLYLYLGRVFGQGTANRVVGGVGLVLSVIWLPVLLLSFLITGMVLIALPSIQEHWDMLKGSDPVKD